MRHFIVGLTTSIVLLAFVNSLQIHSDTYIQWCHKLLEKNAHARVNLCHGKCNCSCDETCQVRHSNFQRCCEAQGVEDDGDNCLNLCRYDVTVSELSCVMGSSCSFQKLSYCAMDSNDDTNQLECCRAKGMPEACLKMCSKDPMSKSEVIHPQYMQCIPFIRDVLQCQYDHLPAYSRWQHENRFFPDEQLVGWQNMTVMNFRSKQCDTRQYH